MCYFNIKIAHTYIYYICVYVYSYAFIVYNVDPYTSQPLPYISKKCGSEKNKAILGDYFFIVNVCKCLYCVFLSISFLLFVRNKKPASNKPPATFIVISAFLFLKCDIQCSKSTLFVLCRYVNNVSHILK